MLFSHQKLAMLTFPGVILHELVHALTCKIFGIEIKEICYLRYGKPAGYIIHSPCRSFVSQFFVTTGPLIVNTILGAWLGYKYFHLYPDTPIFEKVFFGWLALSFLAHSFPSVKDVKNFHKILKKESELVQLFHMPILIVLYIIAHSSYFWIEAVYAWAVVFYFPNFFHNQISYLTTLF